MKNIITFICISLFCILSLSAQIRKGSRDKIKMLKISYLTDRLKLTPDEAQKFWPIYNANDEKQFELRHKKMRSIINKFENEENSVRHLINMENGLISSKTKTVFNNSNKIPLTHDLFNEDALIFKDLKSRKVTLKSDTYGAILSISYKEFPYLGIWAKPNGNYVCIEPWLGIADHEDTNQELKTKEGILSLEANKSFTASYTIEIHNNHLV